MIGAVILAAGFGRRFGADKRVHRLGNSTLAQTTVGKYTSVFERVRVVIRPEDAALRTLLTPLSVDIVTAEFAHAGMGHSLAAGIGDIEWAWAFVALLDMPFIAPSSLGRLREAAQHAEPDRIIVPRYNNDQAPAHPIGWPRLYFEELRGCTGDQGARSVLARHADQIQWVVLNDAGLIRDIDTPQDLGEASVRHRT